MGRPLVAALAAVLLLGACDDGSSGVSLQAEPSESSTASPTASRPSPTPTPTPTPTPSTTAPTGPREPTDTDRARFVATHEPDGAGSIDDVAADLDGDGTEELVFAYVQHDRQVRVDVAWWAGTTYEVVFSDQGGEASSLDRLGVRDLNADDHVEVVTHQSGSGSTASASLWRVPASRQVERLVAVGGCHDGRHTYGVVGVRIADDDGDGADEVEATCDDAPLPVGEWSSDTYVWEAGAYRHDPGAIG